MGPKNLIVLAALIMPAVPIPLLEGSIRLGIRQSEADPGAVEEISISAQASAVLVEDRGVPLTSCYLADARLAIRGERIEIRRANAGGACQGPGTFDLTYTVRGLLPGRHVVSLLDEVGTLLAEEEIRLDPEVIQVEVASCGEPAPGPEQAWIEVRADGLLLGRKNAVENACLAFGASFEVARGILRIREEDRGPPCDCVATFDVAVLISGIAPGLWAFELFDIRGKLAASGEVKIAGPRAIATAGPARWTDPPIPEMDSVRVEGSTVVVERKGAVASCCLDLDAVVTIDGDLLGIREIDRGPPCACIAEPFDLRVEILGLLDGSYRVVAETLEGKKIEGSAVVLSRFVRGAVNRRDATIDIADVLAVLFHLFAGEYIPCRDAADADDDGELGLPDTVLLLEHLFRNGPPPPPPHPLPGYDPTHDGLGCSEPPCVAEDFLIEIGSSWDLIEFCLPADGAVMAAIRSIYPEARLASDGGGEAACGAGRVLGTIDRIDLDRSKLCALSLLAGIGEFRTVSLE